MRILPLTIISFLIIHFSYAQNIDLERLTKNIEFLASDSLKGRFPGTAEDKVSAEFILQNFKDAGLSPMLDDGLQEFEVVTSVKPGKLNSFVFNDFTGELGIDYTPFGFSENGKLIASPVFAGYGFDFESDTLSWKDYDNIDVTDKWVMILRGDPEIDNPFSNFVAHSQDRKKVMIAKDHGAKGVVFVSGVNYDDKDELVSVNYDRASGTAGIPVIHIKRELANQILASNNKTVENLENNLNENFKSNSFEIEATLTGQTELMWEKVETFNVLAKIEGTDLALKEEYIIIGAHYDHLGMGGEGTSSRKKDTIAPHNGADDNASGVVGVIELANSFAKNPPKRSIIFMAFGAEEVGLLGSKYFVKNPPIDIASIKIMFNFDMIGRIDPVSKSLSVSGTGTFTEADSLLNLFLEDYDLQLKTNTDGYGPSDHSSFYMNDIPVLFFSTGAHEDYHTPFDDIERLDLESEVEILNYTFDIIDNIANRENILTFAEASGKQTQSRGGRRLKVTLGIVPDFANTESKGLGVDGVKKGGPAESAGMQKGDRIISMNGEEVTNIYDYMFRLAKLKPGETTIVEVLRNDEVKVLLVQL
jgi:Peptidase family M28/PDZ domain/PA domain